MGNRAADGDDLDEATIASCNESFAQAERGETMNVEAAAAARLDLTLELKRSRTGAA